MGGIQKPFFTPFKSPLADFLGKKSPEGKISPPKTSYVRVKGPPNTGEKVY